MKLSAFYDRLVNLYEGRDLFTIDSLAKFIPAPLYVWYCPSPVRDDV